MKNKTEITQEIINQTKQSIPQITNYNSGSVFRLFIEIVASFLEKIYSHLDELLKNRFLQTANGKYLDWKAEELALSRLPAQKTQGYVTFYKNNNQQITIPKNKIVTTKPNQNGVIYRFKTIEETVILENQTSKNILVEAEFEGSEFNITENQITEITTSIIGIDHISNPSSWITQIGKDIETDSHLRNRCLNQWYGLNGSNANAYIYWAKQIEEVDNIKIIPTARGTGTVDVVFTSANNSIPSQEIIDKVAQSIEQFKPIATDVSVKAPFVVKIDVDVIVTSLPNANISTNIIEDHIRKFFSTLSIGQDFEPSALTGFLFAHVNGIKSISHNLSPSILTDLQIAQANLINVTLSQAMYN